MRTGVSYLGHYNPRHMETDLRQIKDLGCDDVFLAAQENDFVYMKGKLEYFPGITRDLGMRPFAIFWGVLNFFGGGKSSQFLLDHPSAHQVSRDGTVLSAGCYNNPRSLAFVQLLIDEIAARGFAGYFIDEPTPVDCFCPYCRSLFAAHCGGKLDEASAETLDRFRAYCVMRYISMVSEYAKQNHPHMTVSCCMMPSDQRMWEQVGSIASLDDLGTDIYWVNEDTDARAMMPLMADMARICVQNAKTHHQWLQAWGVKKGRESRIEAQGRMIIEYHPDALYVWAYNAQWGTSETCEDPQAAWSAACRILRQAKETP